MTNIRPYLVKNRLTPWNRDFDDIFGDFLRPTRWLEEATSENLIPAIDVAEREHEFLVHAELPGVKKDDIDINLENGVLTITAETKSKNEQKEGDRVIRQERRYGKFVRSLRLGEQVDEAKVKASYKDGVLELVLPKAEAVKTKKISVNVS
ncbi:MAG: Hsp20/alpha crystallin family protein [Gammaproteobacteria bacterium]|nr:Hsp20/alpha crystallin family protein [Gammaproteobacteria bacterium]